MPQQARHHGDWCKKPGIRATKSAMISGMIIMLAPGETGMVVRDVGSEGDLQKSKLDLPAAFP